VNVSKVGGPGKPQPAQPKKAGAVSGVFAELLAAQAGSANASGGQDESTREGREPPHGRDAMEDMRRAFGELSTQSSGMSVAVQRVATGTGLLPYGMLIKNADTTRRLNAASAGGAALTAEQISALNRKYDLGRLSAQEQYDLYCELTHMGVLAAADVESIGMSHIMLKGGFFARAPEFALMNDADLPQGTLLEWTRAAVESERKQYDYMNEIGGRLNSEQGYCDESMKNAFMLFKKNLAGIEKLMARHRRVAEVIETIAGESRIAPTQKREARSNLTSRFLFLASISRILSRGFRGCNAP
jgi:hypothetical protein